MKKEKIKKLRLSKENLDKFNDINKRIYTFIRNNIIDYFEEKSDELLYDEDDPPMFISMEWGIINGEVQLIRSYDGDLMPICSIPLEHLINGEWEKDIKEYFLFYEYLGGSGYDENEIYS